jgi:hypothetical protein
MAQEECHRRSIWLSISFLDHHRGRKEKSITKIKLGKRIMSFSDLKCEGCGEAKDILQGSKGKFLCDICFFRENPPQMKIAEFFSSAYESGSRFFNETCNCYEDTMTITMFQSCGWFLRRIRQKKNIVMYELEYFGNKRCIRCKDVGLPHSLVKFPRSFIPCVNSALC